MVWKNSDETAALFNDTFSVPKPPIEPDASFGRKNPDPDYEERFSALFSDLPLPLCEQDYSSVKEYVLQLQAQGDISTTLRQNHEALRECHRRIRTIDINDEALRLFQTSNKDDFAPGFGMTLYKMAPQILIEICTAFLSGKRIFSSEVALRTMAGIQLTTHCTFFLSPLHLTDWSHVFIAIFDRTEKNTLEAKLRQSEKMEILGRLAGGLAHDFNNQLTTIMGNADFLRDELHGQPSLHHYAETIVRTAKRTSDLTQRLLSFSRKEKPTFIPVDIHALIHEVVMLLQHSIDKKIVISSELKASQTIVLGDPSQLQNALLNLALNARDAMPSGGELLFSTDTRTIETATNLTAEAVLAPGTFIQIRVRDTGTGMDDYVKNHLFEPFFTTKNDGKGTGIGLTTVQTAVKHHKGVILVSSRMGDGTAFTIYLPIEQSVTSRQVPHQEPEQRIKKQHHGTILFIDDEELIGLCVVDMLQKIGYSVTVFTKPRDAMEYFKENWKKIDLVILDMIMPEMNGKDVFYAMREINPDTLAILCSGYGDQEEIQSILADGLKGFLPKPFKQAHVSKIIEETLRSAAKHKVPV